MSVLHPALLAAGLAALALPIVVHLLRRRRRPVEWGAMRFLVEAYRRRRRRVRLERLALLAARCVLVGLIALGIAVPVLGGGAGVSGPRTLVIVLDDSIASAIRPETGAAGAGREIDGSLEHARALLAELNPARGDRVGVIGMAAPPARLAWPPTGDVAAVRAALDRIEPADSGADVAGAIALAREIDEPRGVEIAVLSAWREGSAARSDMTAGASGDEAARVVRWRVSAPALEPAKNVAITEVRPGRDELVGENDEAALTIARVTLRRDASGPDASELDGMQMQPVALFAEGRSGAIARGTAAFEAGQRETLVTLAFDRGELPARAPTLVLRAELEHAGTPDACAADDRAWTTIDVRRSLRAGVVARAGASGVGGFGPADFVRAALRPGSSGGVVEPIEIDPRDLSEAAAAALDVLVLLDPDQLTSAGWAAAKSLAQRGGVVMLTPPAGDASPAWAESVRAALGVRVGATARPIDGGASVQPASGGGGGGGAGGAGPLATIAPDLAELSSGIVVSRAVAIEGGPAMTPVLTLGDGEAWAALFSVGRGRVAVLGSALDVGWTNLPTRPLIVPLLQELARLAEMQGASVRAVAGRAATAGAGWRALTPRIETDAVPPAIESGTIGPQRIAGVFDAIGTDGRRGAVLVISPDAGATRTQPLAPADVEQRLREAADGTAGGDGALPIEWIRAGDEDAPGEAAAGLSETQRGRGPAREPHTIAWVIFAAAGLVALLELALARFASHAERES